MLGVDPAHVRAVVAGPAVVRPGRYCWSCNNQDRDYGERRFLIAIANYEHALEIAEDRLLDGLPISAPILVRGHDRRGGWGCGWRSAERVIHDLHLHGLIRCVKRRSNGACELWEASQNPLDTPCVSSSIVVG